MTSDQDVWDGDWVLFAHDALTGIATWYNPKENLVRKTSDVTKILQSNQADRADQSDRWGDGQRVASIPLDVYYTKLAEAVEQDDRKYLKRFLNDGDNAAWRTREGSV